MTHNSFLEELKEELKLLKVDGIPNIVRSKNRLLQLIWLILLFVFVSICIMLIIDSVNAYLRFDVTTKSRLLRETRATFPTITICQVNPFSTDYATQLMKQANTTSMYALELYTKNTTGAYLTDASKQQLSNFTRMLIKCSFASQTCTSSDFQWVWHPSKYNCYRFNTGLNTTTGEEIALKKVNIAGQNYVQLSLQLYSGLPNYWSQLVGVNGLRGFYVYIHNASEYPFKMSPAPIYLTPGFGMNVNVERSFYTQYNEWPYTYSDCRVDENNELIGPPMDDPDQLFERVLELGNYSYSRETCFMLCAQISTTRACGCNNYALAMRVDGYDLCLTSDQQKCASAFYSASNTNLMGTTSCSAKCPMECFQRVLTPNLRYFQYPTLTLAAGLFYYTPAFRQFHLNETDFSSTYSVTKNMVSLNIFYGSLAYSSVEEKPELSADSLLGTIGGHFHLFLGMSFLSFLEIIEIIFVAIYIRWKQSKD